MTFILRKKSFASLRSNTTPPPALDTSSLPPLPVSVPPTPGTASSAGGFVSQQSYYNIPTLAHSQSDDVFSASTTIAIPESGSGVGVKEGSGKGKGVGKLFGGWGKKDKSHSAPSVPTIAAVAQAQPQPQASSSMHSMRSPTQTEDLGSLGLFPTPPNSHPTLSSSNNASPQAGKHAHTSSVATDFSVPRQHSSNFIAPLALKGDQHATPNSMSTLASSSSFASTALFSDEWESGSEATSAITSSPESGSGMAPRMWKTQQTTAQSQAHQSTDSPLRRECSRSSWLDEPASDSDHASSSRRNSTPVPQMSTSLLPDPSTPPRPKRFSTSTLRAAESSPPFDLALEKRERERERVMSTASVQTTNTSILNFSPASPTRDDIDADDEVSPPRVSVAQMRATAQSKLQQQQGAGNNSSGGLLFASDEPYGSRRSNNRIPSIRFEGISMDAVFAEVEKKMQTNTNTGREEPSNVSAASAIAQAERDKDKKARRRSRVLSQYKALDYGDFSSTPVTTSSTTTTTPTTATSGSSSSLASASSSNGSSGSVYTLASSDSTSSQLDRSATPTPMSAKSLAMGNLGSDVARPRPYPRRTSSRPKPIDLAAANALESDYRSPNATPTNFASAVTPTIVKLDSFGGKSAGELKRSSSLPKNAQATLAGALAEPFGGKQHQTQVQVQVAPVSVPEICFCPPSPALEGGKEWTGVPPSPTVEHGPFPAPAEYTSPAPAAEKSAPASVPQTLPSSTSQAESAILAFSTVSNAPITTKVAILRPKPNIRVSTRPAVKPPQRKRSTGGGSSPVSPPTPPFSSSSPTPTALQTGFALHSARVGDGSPTTPTDASFNSFPVPPHMKTIQTPERARVQSGGSDLSGSEEEEQDALESMLMRLNRPHTPPTAVEEQDLTPRLGSAPTFAAAAPQQPASPLTAQALEQQQAAFLNKNQSTATASVRRVSPERTTPTLVHQASFPARVAKGDVFSEDESDHSSSSRFGDAPFSLAKRRSQMIAQKKQAGGGGGFTVIGGGMGRAPLVQIQPPSEVDSGSEGESYHQTESSAEEEDEVEGGKFEYELDGREREENDEWEDESLASSASRDSVRSLKGLGLSSSTTTTGQTQTQEELEDEIEATLMSLSSSNEFNSFDARHDDHTTNSHSANSDEDDGEEAPTPRLPQSESTRSFDSFLSDEEEGATLGYLMTRPLDSSPEQATHRGALRAPRNYSPFGLSSSPSEESIAELGYSSPPRPTSFTRKAEVAVPRFTVTAPKKDRVSSLSRSSGTGGHGYSDSSSSSASLSSLASNGSEDSADGDGYESEPAVVMTGQRVSYASYEVGMAI